MIQFDRDYTFAERQLLDQRGRKNEDGIHVHLLNAYSLCIADKDPDYQDVLRDNFAVNLCDGKSVEIAANILYRSQRLRQVRGPDFFRAMLDKGRENDLKHCFLGSTPMVLDLLVERVKELFPGVKVACAISPPFREATAQELADQDALISASGADIIWVGLGTPKQDFEAQRVTEATGIDSVAIGAAFDFLAGTTREPPHVIRGSGFEWVYRLISEPRRLWKRYLIGNVHFVILILREALKR